MKKFLFNCLKVAVNLLDWVIFLTTFWVRYPPLCTPWEVWGEEGYCGMPWEELD